MHACVEPVEPWMRVGLEAPVPSVSERVAAGGRSDVGREAD